MKANVTFDGAIQLEANIRVRFSIFPPNHLCNEKYHLFIEVTDKNFEKINDIDDLWSAPHKEFDSLSEAVGWLHDNGYVAK